MAEDIVCTEFERAYANIEDGGDGEDLDGNKAMTFLFIHHMLGLIFYFRRPMCRNICSITCPPSQLLQRIH